MNCVGDTNCVHSPCAGHIPVCDAIKMYQDDIQKAFKTLERLTIHVITYSQFNIKNFMSITVFTTVCTSQKDPITTNMKIIDFDGVVYNFTGDLLKAYLNRSIDTFCIICDNGWIDAPDSDKSDSEQDKAKNLHHIGRGIKRKRVKTVKKVLNIIENLNNESEKSNDEEDHTFQNDFITLHASDDSV